MKMFLIDVVKGTAGSVDVKPELDEYYKVLNCKTVQMVERCIEGVYYNFICDEEGTFVENPKLSAVDSDCKRMFVGNLLVCLLNNEGNEAELCNLDIELLNKHVTTAVNKSGSWYVLKDVEY